MIQTTKEELDYIVAKLKPKLMEMLREYSVGVGEIELATDLNGINSFPVVKRIAGVDKVVEIPLVLITDPALESIEEAKRAAAQANQAAQTAQSSIDDIENEFAGYKEELEGLLDPATGSLKEMDNRISVMEKRDIFLTEEEFKLIIPEEDKLYFIYEES